MWDEAINTLGYGLQDKAVGRLKTGVTIDDVVSFFLERGLIIFDITAPKPKDCLPRDPQIPQLAVGHVPPSGRIRLHPAAIQQTQIASTSVFEQTEGRKPETGCIRRLIGRPTLQLNSKGSGKQYDRRHIVVDVETTGFSHACGERVIEIGAVAVEFGEIVEEFGTLVYVDREIHWKAEEVHGISKKMLVGNPRPEEVWPRFIEFVADSPLVAHKADFDMGFIEAELCHLNLKAKFSFICTLALSQRLYPQLSNHRLETVARHVLGEIPRDLRLHRALDDARLLAQAWYRMSAQTK